MSSRALRRLQKEQIPDISPPANEEEEQETEEEDYVEEKTVKQINPFDLLNGDDDDVEEEVDEQEDEIIEEVEKPVVQQPAAEKKPSSKKNKKRNNKKKTNKKQQTKDEVEDLSMKELDKVLKELGDQSNRNDAESSSHSNALNHQLLAVNYRFLDAEAEMKRLFGSHVVNSENRASQGRVLKKSKFTTPKSDWAPYKRNGLSMELVETKNGISYYAFRHSEQYQDVQLEFLNAIATHNPEALVFLIRRYPYHVDGLLQLSEIAKHSGDWSAAGDFIERALYSCERALHPQFSLTSGTVRLSYQRSENRSFFLAIFRHIQFLTRRGCWRTAFEFNKLLFSLDPDSDPLGALLSLDYHALSARDFDYVITMHDTWKTDGNLYPAKLSDMPNFAYSAAYASFKRSEKSKNADDVKNGSAMLKEAIKKYPLVYCRLMEKLGEPEVSETVALTQYIPNDYMEIMQLSYIERTWEMWKEPEVLQWFTSVGSHSINYPVEHPEVIQQTLKCQQNEQVPLSVCRYIVLTDVRQLMSYLPSSVTSSSYQMYDPLPPEDSVTMYDINERMCLNRSGGVGLMPDARGLLDRLRGLLGQNNQIPAEDQAQIRQLMNELEAIRGRTAGQAPGAFPADDYVDDSVFDDVYEDGDDYEAVVEATYPDLIEDDQHREH